MSAYPQSHYTLLGVSPWASQIDIRRAYRELSKQYHPDTTQLPMAIAREKFQALNQAYATLSSPEQRLVYDLHHGYSHFSVIQAPLDPPQHSQGSSKFASRNAYLDPSDRPLSSGELFAVLLLGGTVVGCLLLAVLISLSRGDLSM
ncbi:MAG: J domain-containing protein [Cyanobacteria bacterium P01_E01_bin.6]